MAKIAKVAKFAPHVLTEKLALFWVPLRAIFSFTIFFFTGFLHMSEFTRFSEFAKAKFIVLAGIFHDHFLKLFLK